MSEIKSKIGLIATEITFTEFSIVYHVKLEGNVTLEKPTPVLVTPFNIADKDLSLKPTILSKENMKVVFSPVNMQSQYLQTLLDKTTRNYREHRHDLRNYYLVGDIVAYIIS